jgi:hypothetical protein
VTADEQFRIDPDPRPSRARHEAYGTPPAPTPSGNPGALCRALRPLVVLRRRWDLGYEWQLCIAHDAGAAPVNHSSHAWRSEQFQTTAPAHRSSVTRLVPLRPSITDAPRSTPSSWRWPWRGARLGWPAEPRGLARVAESGPARGPAAAPEARNRRGRWVNHYLIGPAAPPSAGVPLPALRPHALRHPGAEPGFILLWISGSRTSVSGYRKATRGASWR